MFVGVGDDGDIEPGSLHVEDGEADAVEADGAFFDDEVAEFLGEFEAEFPAAVEFFAFGADGGGVDVTLNDMAVESAVHEEASFQVDEVAGFPVAQIGLFQGFPDGGHAVEIVFELFDGEADAVVGDALVYFEFAREGGGDPECLIGAVGLDGFDFAEGFDDAGKHRALISHFLATSCDFREIGLYLLPEH